MNNLTRDTQLTILYIFIAFTFSVLMRMIWVYQFEELQAFKYAGEFMINTNDGYYWAEGARDLLGGTSTNPSAENFYDKLHQLNDLSPVSGAASQLTAFFATLLPFSFETIILYMPVYLSSLVVIPIVLIAKALDNLEMGFIAALLASIAWSYYNRTMVGYYDTDMLNIVLPMFLLWSIIWAVKTNEDKYLLITALDILLYRWWYPQSYALEFSFFGLILVYALVFDRKNLYNYKLLALMMFAMINLDGFIRFPLVIAAFYIFKQEQFQKYIYYILAFSIVLFFISGGFDPIWGKLKAYVFKDTVSISEEGLGLHFFTVMQTIREAGQIPFETFANRISGHVITFIISVAGYIYLVYRHKIMLFSLPMVGLGFLAAVGGLRFTIYAVPILAFGVAFLITEVSTRFPIKLGMTGEKLGMTGEKLGMTGGRSVRIKYLSMIALTSAILFPNYKHIESYKVPTVFNSDEVAVLDVLRSKADREDYVVSWWDYGYPIRYYADVKTLADGGKHSGSVNFPISFMLTSSQKEAAKMARLDVEYTERAFEIRDKNKELNETDKIKLFTNIEEMTKKHGFGDTNDFLVSLQTDIELPKKTRDIYFYLPFRMLNIYPTVKVFSNMDLMSGEKYQVPFFFVSRSFKEAGDRIDLAQNISIDKKDFSLNIGGKKVEVKRFVKTFYDEKMELKKDVRPVSFNGKLNVVYMASYNTFLVLDEPTYNSLYIQLMVLEEFDKTLFEKVVANPHAKVYKLKI